ncbi:type VII secretion protein EsxR [Nocardia sp. NPDC057353]|uniref:type VII secretion protein EsxR n=1 Tax=Nocardia sp. NPDC057353 TaxID=3346104 RepID=UPI003642EAD2
MTILYDPTTMNALYDELARNGQNIANEIDQLMQQANNYEANLTGDNGRDDYVAKKTQLFDELADTKVKLDQLGAEVENALARALEADGKVGDGFASF